MEKEIKVQGISFRVDGWKGMNQKQMKEKAERQGLKLSASVIRELHGKLNPGGRVKDKAGESPITVG